MATFDVRMPDGTIIRGIPEGTTKEEVMTKHQKSLTPSTGSDESSLIGELGKGIGRGLTSTGALLVEGLPAVGKNIAEQITGNDYGAKEQTQKLGQTLSDINTGSLKPSVESYTDINGLGDLGEYAAGAVGTLIPDIAGGLGAGALTKGIAKTAIKDLTKSGAEKSFAAGVLGYGAATEAPSTQVSTFNETGELPSAGNLAATTAVKAYLEKVGDMVPLNTLRQSPDKSILTNIAKGAFKQAGVEGTTEGFQQIADELSAELTNPEKANFDTKDVIESFIQGAIGGSITGAALGGINSVAQPQEVKESKPPEEILNTEELPSEEVVAPPPIQSEEVVQKPADNANDIFKQATTPVDTPSNPPVQPVEQVSTPEVPTDIPVPAKVPEKPPVNDLEQVPFKPEQEKFKPLKLTDIVNKDSFSNPLGYQFKTNAVNGKQAQYAKVADDLSKLVGINVPIDVVFKTGKQGFVDTLKNPTIKQNISEALINLNDPAQSDSRLAAAAMFRDEDGGSRIALLLDDTGKTDSEITREIQHELGHGIAKSLIQQDKGLSNLVLKDYNNKARQANKKGMTPQEFTQLISSQTFDKEGQPKLEGVSINKGFQATVKPSEFFGGRDSYFMSFDEYLAEGIARWMQTDAKPISVVDKYFKALADTLRNFAKYFVENGWYPNDTINEVMNRLVDQAKGRAFAGTMVKQGPELALQNLRAYHASPYYVEKFSTEYVNTGEGTQNEGWGLYFASMKDVAKWYHEMFQKGDRAKASMRLKTKQNNAITIQGNKQITQALESLPQWDLLEKDEQQKLQYFVASKYYQEVVGEDKSSGTVYNQGKQIFNKLGLTSEIIEGVKPKLYSVELNVDEDKMLLWDVPFEQQTEQVKQILQSFTPVRKAIFEKGNVTLNMTSSGLKGSMLYSRLKDYAEGSSKEVSLLLNQLGIQGIKYLDQDSRATSKGVKTHNYVVFNDAAIEIRKVFDDENEFLVSDLKRAPKTQKVEDTKEYKYVHKPEATKHEVISESITGDGEGEFQAFDKKGTLIGTLAYTKDKNKLTIDSVDLKQNGQRQRQDTTYALIDAVNKAKLAPAVMAADQVKPYQSAYERIQKLQETKPVAKEPVKPDAKITDVKPVPLFEKNVLPLMSQRIQKFFKSLPKSIGLQVSVVDSVLNRSTSVSSEMRFAMSNPDLFGLTKNDIQTLLNQKDAIVKFVSDNFRQGVDTPYLLSQRNEDIIPDAYDAYIEAKEANRDKFDTALTNDVKAIFDKLEKNVQGLKEELTRNAVTKLEDIFYVPTTFDKVGIDVLAKDNFNELEQADRMTNVEKQQSYDDLMKVKIAGGSIGSFSKLMKYLSPAVNVAKNSPLVGRIFNLAMGRREYMINLQNTLMSQLKPSIIQYEGKPEVFNALVGVLESNRLNGFKGFIDQDGFFNYKDKQGVRRRVADQQKSQEIENIRNIFNKVLDERVNISMSHRDTQELFRGVGLSYKPTAKQINSILRNHSKKLSAAQVSSLENIEQYLNSIDMLKSRDYVPFTRKGSHGVTIKIKGEGGKKETVAFVTYDKDSKGNPVQDENWVKAQRIINDYAGKPEAEISSEFELTKDALLGQISNKEMTIDIIEQLVELMTDSSSKTNLSTEDTPATQPAWKALGQILVTDVMKKGFEANMKQAKNIGGYRDNWYNVVPLYLQGASFAMSNQRFAPLMRHALRASQTGAATPEEKAYAKQYAESLLNVEGDVMNTLRNIQFNYALGFNLSSALIQLTSFTTLMPATLTLMTSNPLRSYRLLMKAASDSNKFFKFQKDSLYDLSPDNIRKIGLQLKWSDDKINAVQRISQKGFLTQTLSIEEIGSDIHDKTTLKGRIDASRDKVTRIAGLGLRATEELSRLSQFLAMYDALDNPNNVNRFHNIIYKDSAAYREHLKVNPNLGFDKEYLLKEGINLSLALFGKEGRAPFQNSYFQFIFPFATYPWQAFINFYRLASTMGPEGRKAAMVAASGIVFGAGVVGLPGAMLLKELVETVLSQVFEEDIDLDKEMMELNDTYKDESPWTYNLGNFIQRGAFSSFSGVDLNERLQFQTPFDTHIKTILDWIRQGEPPSNALQNVGGVLGGSIAMMPFTALAKYKETGGSLPETINTLMPVAMRNLISSLVIEPEKGKSIMDTQVLTSTEARETGKMVAGVAGFKSRDEGLMEERARAISQTEKRLDSFKTAYARKLQRFYKDYQRSPNNSESLINYQKALDEYVQFLTTKGFSSQQIQSSVKQIMRDAQQEVLSETDKELNKLFKLKGAAKEARDDLLPLLHLGEE